MIPGWKDALFRDGERQLRGPVAGGGWGGYPFQKNIEMAITAI